MKCAVCNKEFEAKRNDAKTCSDKCRQASKRLAVTGVTDNPEIVTDKDLSVTLPIKSVTGKTITLAVEKHAPLPLQSTKDWTLCCIDGCNLPNQPGHKGMCIYHWRISENMPSITERAYRALNEQARKERMEGVEVGGTPPPRG